MVRALQRKTTAAALRVGTSLSVDSSLWRARASSATKRISSSAARVVAKMRRCRQASHEARGRVVDGRRSLQVRGNRDGDGNRWGKGCLGI